MRNTLVQIGFTAHALLALVLSAEAETRLCEGRRGVFSPDGARIAFECARGGRLAVGVVPVSGGETTWIVDGPGNAGQPAWMADGSLLYTYCHVTNTALATVRGKVNDGGANIWRWKDGRAEQLTRGRSFDYGVSSAPDGTVWFVTTRGAQSATLENLCTAHIAAWAPGTRDAEVRLRFTKSNNGAMSPTVSPDGCQLLWSEMRGFRGNWRLDVAPIADLAKGRALTPPDASCHSPRWSPDGRRVCYTGYRVGDPGWCVYVQDVATGETTRVCEGRNPCFSPDEKTLLYDRDGSLFTCSAPPSARARLETRKQWKSGQTCFLPKCFQEKVRK